MYAKLETRTFLALLVGVSLAFVFLMKPFFGPIFWAVAIALIFHPVQQLLVRKLGDRPNINALITLCICMFIVVIPVLVLVTSLVAEGVALYQQIQSGAIRPGEYIDRVNQSFPAIQAFLAQFDISFAELRDRAVSIFVGGSQFLGKQALGVGQNTFQFFLGLALMVYLAFFLLRDGSALVELIIRALPLGDERERLLFAKFAEVTRATVKGNLLIAIIQGAGRADFLGPRDLRGLALGCGHGDRIAVAGGGCRFGLGARCHLPRGGWRRDRGGGSDAFGVVVIGLADNLLRPVLVGRDTKLPDYIVLLSTLGGIVMFGINGFVMGPLVAALFMAFWGIFIREFSEEAHRQPATVEDKAHESDRSTGHDVR